MVSGWVTRVLCHHRRFEEETSENEAAAEEEEGEEDMFSEKSSPEMDECPAVKVGRAGEMGRAILGKLPSTFEPGQLEKAQG